MCLSVPKLITPKKDIVCYKVLKVYNDKSSVFVSEFQSFHYELGHTYSTNKNKPKIVETVPTLCRWKIVIEGDAFHSFKTVMGAKGYCKKYGYSSSVNDYNYVIVKCVIPKESKYIYEGDYDNSWGTGYKSYASQMIKPIEVIK